jgi:hypothetical protein
VQKSAKVETSANFSSLQACQCGQSKHGAMLYIVAKSAIFLDFAEKILANTICLLFLIIFAYMFQFAGGFLGNYKPPSFQLKNVEQLVN